MGNLLVIIAKFFMYITLSRLCYVLLVKYVSELSANIFGFASILFIVGIIIELFSKD